ncbi:MAG: ferritin-like fold-containing protein [Lacisediminihabitans sp.]
MVTLFGRRGKRVNTPKLKSRSDIPANVSRVSLGELTPELLPYLGQAAYLQLTIFETLSRAILTAPTTDAKEAVSRVAALSLAKYHGLTDEIERTGEASGPAMAPYTARIDDYRRRVQGDDWYETMVATYLTGGLLDDFFLRLAAGLPAEYATRIAALLSADSGSDILVEQLRSAIDTNPRLAARLAMWGRRLVGDTVLIARSALAVPQDSAPDEARLEPVFTELIAAHTRRMDALGLTA